MQDDLTQKRTVIQGIAQKTKYELFKDRVSPGQL